LSHKEGIFIFEFMSETPNATRKFPELRVRGVGNQTKQDLNNIAKNLGITISDLVKSHLPHITDSYSATMKLPPKKD
jgi:hypothetical protein